MADSPEWDTHAWNERHALLYSVQMNRLYHHKRERFFSLLDRSGKALALISGTAAASPLLPSPEAKAVAGAIVAAVTLPGLVFAWADKARLHAEISAEYVRLESDIVAAGMITCADIARFQSRSIDLGVKEPPGLSALLRQCQNEMAIAQNQTDKVYPLRWYERWLVNLFDFPRETF